MSYQTMTTPADNTAYDSGDFSLVVDNIIWLKNQRVTTTSGTNSTAWAIAAYDGDGDWEDDGTLSVAVTVNVSSTVIVKAVVRWESDTQRDSSVRMRVKYASSYTTGGGYAGEPDADCYQLYTFEERIPAQSAGTLTVKLSAGKNNTADTVTITNRTLYIEVVPE